MLSIVVSIAVASLFAAITMIAEHYAPWGRYIAGRDVHPVVNYVSGMLGILLPFSALAIYQGANAAFTPWIAALAVWSISIVSGVSVAACYLIDGWYHNRTLIKEADEREKLHREQLNITG
jgi:hypothetical protein